MFTLLYKFWTASIQRQLILGIALIHAILMSIFVFDLVERQREFLLKQNTTGAQALAKTLAANGTSWIISNDTLGMEEVIDSQKNFAGLEYAMFIDMEGRVLGYTDRSQVNSYINDPVSLKLLKAPARNVILLENDVLIDVAAPILINSQQIGWARVGISRKGITENLMYVSQSGVVYTLLAITIGIIFAWFMGRGLTSGLRKLSSVTHGIADGDRKLNCDLKRHDELGALSEDFNKMLSIIKNRERDLNKNLSLLDALLDSISDIVFYKDLNGLYMGCNTACEVIMGAKEKEIIGKSDYEFFPKELADFFRENDEKMLASGSAQHNEEYVDHPDGRRILLHTVKTPFYTLNGELIGLIGIARDITLIREQEEQLRSSRKMDALGKLTGGIAHDYNNLLGVILGYSELLERKLINQPILTSYVEKIAVAGKRGATLTNKLLTFSKSKPAKISCVNINDIINQSHQMLEKTLTASIEIKLNLELNLWHTRLDADDFDNALLNICINAMHAMDGYGKLLISTSNIALDKDDASSLSLPIGDYVMVSISDTGTGMDRETISKVFDPFFSTKGELGTGLGLSQVYGFIKRCDGGINIDSALGKGTTFNLYFPKDSSNCSKKTTKKHQMPTANKTSEKTILIVDDEGALGEIMQEFISSAGFITLLASSGSEALNILHNQNVNLLLTDIIMPKMNGHQLATKAEEIQPGIKVLFTSGYSSNIILEESNLKYETIQKPVNIEELIAKINELLAE